MMMTASLPPWSCVALNLNLSVGEANTLTSHGDSLSPTSLMKGIGELFLKAEILISRLLISGSHCTRRVTSFLGPLSQGNRPVALYSATGSATVNMTITMNQTLIL